MQDVRTTVSRRAAAIVMALMLMPLAAHAQTKIKAGWNLFSPQQDVEIGQQSKAEAAQQLPLLNDREVNDYVNSIGLRLARNAGGPEFPYEFRVVNASDINAFALPGGPVFINRGVIEQARNEGEVAGVLAHEIAHVALRHGTHQASKAYATQAGISILGGLLGGHIGANAAQILNTVGGVGLNVLFLKYSRDLESQADIRGAQILAASGYSPGDMVSFFHTLERVDKSRKTSFLSDHPAPPDRITRIEKEAKLLRVSDAPTANVAQLNRIKDDMRRYGAAPTMEQIARSGPAAGRTRTSSQPPMTSSTASVEAPSSSYRSFTAPSGVYRVSYPSNWRVYQTSSVGATIAPEGGIVSANGRDEILYGAIISHYEPFNNGGRSYLRGGGGVSASLTDATNDLLSQIVQDSPHLRMINGTSQRFEISGGPAVSASLRGTNPNTGIAERVTVVTRQLADDHLVYLLFVTPERDASRYGRVLEAMVNSMRVDETHQH
jgi:Zn-dependent protease with chaperone function